MTTSPSITETESLLRELVSAFVDKPEAVELHTVPLLARQTAFMLSVAPEDESRAIGQRGSHVNALALLVQEMGAKAGTPYLLSLQTTGGPQMRQDSPPRASGEFSLHATIALIGRVLTKIVRHKFRIEVDEDWDGTALTVRLTLCFDQPADSFAIRRPTALLTTATNGRDPLLLDVLGSLGTLARAIGRKSGVRIHLQLAAAPQDVQAGNY